MFNESEYYVTKEFLNVQRIPYIAMLKQVFLFSTFRMRIQSKDPNPKRKDICIMQAWDVRRRAVQSSVVKGWIHSTIHHECNGRFSF